ncbi:helix-turn-helix domain-containing protein [Pyrobaculum sp.]|uniref:helix-turn-helix domain-containing protein n=1 Tax=Pyrobaculum sp. TaxID=2004705 RepID=UPI003D0BB242
MFVNPYWVKLSDEQRIDIVRCLREALGLSVSDIARLAGVTPAAVAQWLSGRSAPAPEKLQKMHEADPNTVERCLPEPPVGRLDVDQALQIISKALRDKALRDYVIQQLSVLLPGQVKAEAAYRVEREDLEVFKKKLELEGLAYDTRTRHLRYLTRFLQRGGWVISQETIEKIYTAETPKIAQEMAKSLKKFIDVVVRARDPQLAALLYDSFKVPRVKKKNSYKIPTLEEVKRVWEEASKISPCAAAFWGLLAETGIRARQLHKATLAGLQLERRRLLVGETEGTKRQPVVFLTEGAVRYLQTVYLPWRDRFEKMLGQRTERLFPCELLTIYRWLKEAREKAGLPWLEPKLLRKFNAQWLLDQGVDVSDIAMLQGRALPSSLAITIEHYVADYEKRLRTVFEQHAPRVFP